MKNILYRVPQDYGVKVLSDDTDGGVVFNSSYPMFGVDIRKASSFKTYKIHITSATSSEPPTQPTTGYYSREFTLATIPHGMGKIPTFYAFWDIANSDISIQLKARFDLTKTYSVNADDYPATYNAIVNATKGVFHDIYQFPHYGKDTTIINGAMEGVGKYVLPFSRPDDYHSDNTTNTRQAEGIIDLVYLEADDTNIYVKIKCPYWVNQEWVDSWSADPDIFYVYRGLAKEWASLVGSVLTFTLFVTPY